MISPIAPKKDETIDISHNMLSEEKQKTKKQTLKSTYSYQRGPVKTTVTRTTYEVRTSPKKKISTHHKTWSPTKRLMEMKNSSEQA